jgi:tripartite-type tricarboxylate transporter receptor subunit TctC
MSFQISARNMTLLTLLSGIAFAAAAQQNFPTKPIRIITPYAAGGSTSIMARMVGQQFTEAWGQPVIVDSRPGGNGAIGTEFVARSAADGYTLVLTSKTHVNVPLLQATSYDPIKDFSAIAAFAKSELFMVLNNQVPANTMQEFIAYAKTRPGQLNYSSSGTGTAPHLAAELFNMVANVKMVHVPYKGAVPAVVDLMGGQVQVTFQSSLNVVPQIQTGRIKALGVSGKSRLAALPNVPTFSEVGLPDLNVGFWYGILGPASIPKAVVDKLAGELSRLVTRLDTRTKFSELGIEPEFVGPEPLGSSMKSDMEKFSKLIKSANIKLVD